MGMTRAPVAEWKAAFKTWDTAAARIGQNADTAIEQGRRPRPPSTGVLEAETARLAVAERRVGVPLGYAARVGVLRQRAGWTLDMALDAIAAEIV